MSGKPLLPCTSIALAEAQIIGTYGMWAVERNECVQYMSDSLANSTSNLADPSAFQVVPAWIFDLPEPKKSIKINYVHKYGSPNVFSEFDPQYVTCSVRDNFFLQLGIFVFEKKT